MSTVQSSTKRPHQLLSSSYIEHHDKIKNKGAHFWKQNIKGGWITVPRGTDEHALRMGGLENTIRDLQARGK